MYIGVQLTLAVANTAYNLKTLIDAIEPMLQGTADEVVIQADSGAGTVLVGDSQISGTRYGYVLAPGDSRTYRLPGRIRTNEMWLRSATAGKKVNVEVLA